MTVLVGAHVHTNKKLKLPFDLAGACAEGTLQVRDRGGGLRPTVRAVGAGRDGAAGDAGAPRRHQGVLN